MRLISTSQRRDFSFFASERAKENNWLAGVEQDEVSDLFPRKTTAHAVMAGDFIKAEDQPDLLNSLLAKGRKGPAAAYVHLPYCETKCLYCGFFGGRHSLDAGQKYLESLFWEIDAKENLPSTLKEPINALYLGGGTPTALEAKQLYELITKLRKKLPLANDCEITVEGRIFNFDNEKMEACLEAGANRFSLGVQTFNTAIRQSLGRVEPREKLMERLAHLASYNQAAVVIDLIYGLPGQSIADWHDDINTFLTLPLDGVDLYQLKVFPDSALAKAIKNGKIAPVAPDSSLVDYFTTGNEIMKDARFRKLSISHWGRGSRERNIYNPLAKLRTDCLNFGSGAGGALHDYFLFNQSGANDYMNLCQEKRLPFAGLVTPPAAMPVVRTILEGMEICRMDLRELDKAVHLAWPKLEGLASSDLFATLLDNWESAALISKDGPWVELSSSGQFWQVNLTHALLGWTKLLSEELA